jgi:outer membrane protein TolC
MRILSTMCTIGIALGPTPAARADDRAPVDLAALLSELNRSHPQLLAFRARAEAAERAAEQREAPPDPKLQTTYTNDGLSGFTLGDSEFTNLTVAWEQEVPSRSVRHRSAEVARAGERSLRAGDADLLATLRARVIGSYTELWRLDRVTGLLVESRTALTAAARAAQARYESGEGIQESLIRAQSAVHRIDLAIDENALDRRRAEIELGADLGRSGDSRFGEVRELPEIAAPLDPEQIASAAGAASPDVGVSSARERAAAAELDDAKAQLKPTYSWLAAYQFRGGLDPMVMGGFSVRLPLWKGRKQERAIEGATLAQQAAAYDREDAIVRAAADARAMAAEIASIDARLRLYDEAIVPQAAAAFESANAAFASGRADMAIVLDDFNRWVETRREELALRARRVQTAATLEAVAGSPILTIPNDRRTP